MRIKTCLTTFEWTPELGAVNDDESLIGKNKGFKAPLACLLYREIKGDAVNWNGSELGMDYWNNDYYVYFKSCFNFCKAREFNDKKRMDDGWNNLNKCRWNCRNTFYEKK